MRDLLDHLASHEGFELFERRVEPFRMQPFCRRFLGATGKPAAEGVGTTRPRRVDSAWLRACGMPAARHGWMEEGRRLSTTSYTAKAWRHVFMNSFFLGYVNITRRHESAQSEVTKS